MRIDSGRFRAVFPRREKAIIFRTPVETLIISTATKYMGDMKENGEEDRKMEEEKGERISRKSYLDS